MTDTGALDRPRAWPEDAVEVVRIAYPPLLALARRLSGSRPEAEDLVQEALVESLSRHPDFVGITYPLGYLRTVVYRLAFARRRRRWTEVPLDLQEQVEATVPPTDDRLLAEDAMATLGPKQRACLVLRFLHGLDDEAIAAVLRCSRSTVRSQIARALAQMRDVIGDDLDG